MSYLEERNMKYLYIIAALLILADILAYSLHLTHEIPGFSAAFGFVGCIILIYFSKFIGRFITKKEDYYERFRKVS